MVDGTLESRKLDTVAVINGPLVSIITVVFNRPGPLQDTIDSVRRQTYKNIEYVLIDGGSYDETPEVITKNSDFIDVLVSEKDHGIYDAINKGIDRANGEYVFILHAGDIFETDFVEKSVKEISKHEGDPGKIITFANYKHGDRNVDAGSFGPGLFLYHFGINHSTFLVPKAIYEAIGGYNPNLKIVSDAIWMREALNFGCEFKKVGGYPLYFDTGGASSAQSEKQRELVIREWVASYRIHFTFLSEPAARAIYLYRFEEQPIHMVVLFLQECRHMQDAPHNWELFLEALEAFLRHIWSLRPLNVREDPEDLYRATHRLEVADFLGIPLELTNLEINGRKIADLMEEIENAANRVRGRSVTLHFLEVFSRPSETFIPDLVNALQADSDDVHMILCEQRRLAEERPFDNILVFPYNDYPERISKWLLSHFLEQIELTRFVFHFAINGWRLLERIDPKYRDIPALYMTHGIDVANLADVGPYRTFIIDGASRLPNVRFTAVSEYLKRKLLDAGAPEEKISVVHNAVHKRFWDNRKPGHEKVEDRQASAFDVRLVNIGRLVPFKGQTYLIEAIALLKAKHAINAHLTIVWGGDGPLLGDLTDQIRTAGLEGQVDLVESVNFDETPHYFDQFDIFVSSSIETEGRKSRSETFGVSILEAIAAGLPVVVANAGAQPEVIGSEAHFARLAEANSSESLAHEISQLYGNGSISEDNASYATERLQRFSRARQVAQIKQILTPQPRQGLSAALFSTAIDRGAGGGAYKAHKSLLDVGVRSRIHCLEHTADFAARVGVVAAPRGAYHRERTHQLNNREMFRQNTIFSLNAEGLESECLADMCADVDVINLHWYARFLSSENVAQLSNMGKPLVITVRDMHPFTGGCHFSHGCEEWRRSCAVCPQLPKFGAQIPHGTLMWKLNNWNLDNITVVALSEFSKGVIAQSRLFGDCRIEVIPNPVDADVFYPSPVLKAREEFGVDPNAKIITYLPSFNSSIKGGQEAIDMLRKLPATIDGRPIEVLVAGADMNIEDLPIKIVKAGYIEDRDKLARFFSASDVTLVPSLAETFSNTVQESLACGTPVAGFKTGAIPEMAQGDRGGVAELGDVIGLTEIVEHLLKRDEKPIEACRAYVTEHHAPVLVGQKYADLFGDLCKVPKAPKALKGGENTIRELQRRYVVERLRDAQKSIQKARRMTPEAPQEKLLNMVRLGGSAKRLGDRILVSKGEPQHVIYGPYLKPSAGVYDVTLDLTRRDVIKGVTAPLVFELAMNGSDILLQENVTLKVPFVRRKFKIRFDYSADLQSANKDGLEFRLWSDGGMRFDITGLSFDLVE